MSHPPKQARNRKVKVASEPETLLALLKDPPYHFRCRNGTFSALAEAELPVACVETRHMQSVGVAAMSSPVDRL